MKVNVAITKILVFRNRGPLRQDEIWNYNDQLLEVVQEFNYVGVVFNVSGLFHLNNQYVIGKALRASSMLLHNIFTYEVKPSIVLQLFDTFVGSVLTIGCPVWGFTKSKDIERVQMKFCKSVLGVKQTTSTTAIYGELGRFPFNINRLTAIVKYWLKLTKTEHIILQTLFKSMIDDDDNGMKH